MFYPLTIQQRLWISSFVPCALLDSGIQRLTRHSPCPHRPAESVLTTHFIFNYLILVMIQTTSEKNGDQQGMWMGALVIARWQPQEVAKMKAEPRAWVRGRVFNCSVLGGHCLGEGEDKMGYFSPAYSSSRGCDEDAGKSRVGRKSVLEPGRIESWHGWEPRCPLTLSLTEKGVFSGDHWEVIRVSPFLGQ